jgi:hypothetical protein
MIKKRWARLAVLACAGCASVGLIAIPASAAAKTKTKTFNRCMSAAMPIPDGPPLGNPAVPNPVASVALRVKVPKFKGKPQLGRVTKVHTVGVRIAHTDDGDLALFLVSPGGRAIALSEYRDQSSNNSGNGYGEGVQSCAGSLVLFGDGFPNSIVTPANTGVNAPITGSFSPEQPLDTFIGGPAAGFWTLLVQDITGPDIGTINALSLNLTYRYKVKKKRR